MKIKHIRYDVCEPVKPIVESRKTNNSFSAVDDLYSRLYSYQREILHDLVAGKSIHVLKARQIGITTLSVVYSCFTILAQNKRPEIVTLNYQMKRHIEKEISKLIGNRSWKDLSVGWVMYDEIEWVSEQKLRDCRNYNCQFFSYSSLNPFKYSIWEEYLRPDIRLKITHRDALKNQGYSDEEITQIQNKTKEHMSSAEAYERFL